MLKVDDRKGLWIVGSCINKLKLLDYTCSDVALDCEEVRVLVDDNVLYIVRQICLI